MQSLPTNHTLAGVYFSKNKVFHDLLDYSIHSKLTYSSLNSLITFIMNDSFVNS